MKAAANDNDTDEDSERRARQRTLMRLTRKGNVSPFDVVRSEGPVQHVTGRVG
jgi:hypothetical protein